MTATGIIIKKHQWIEPSGPATFAVSFQTAYLFLYPAKNLHVTKESTANVFYVLAFFFPLTSRVFVEVFMDVVKNGNKNERFGKNIVS